MLCLYIYHDRYAVGISTCLCLLKSFDLFGFRVAYNEFESEAFAIYDQIDVEWGKLNLNSGGLNLNCVNYEPLELYIINHPHISNDV